MSCTCRHQARPRRRARCGTGARPASSIGATTAWCRASRADFPQSPFLLSQAARPTPANPCRRPPEPRQRRLLCSSRTALVPKKREAPLCGAWHNWRVVSCEPMVQAWPTLPPIVLNGQAGDAGLPKTARLAGMTGAVLREKASSDTSLLVLAWLLSFGAQVCLQYNLATTVPQPVVIQRHGFFLAVSTYDVKVSVCRTDGRQLARKRLPPRFRI